MNHLYSVITYSVMLSGKFMRGDPGGEARAWAPAGNFPGGGNKPLGPKNLSPKDAKICTPGGGEGSFDARRVFFHGPPNRLRWTSKIYRKVGMSITINLIRFTTHYRDVARIGRQFFLFIYKFTYRPMRFAWGFVACSPKKKL